MSRYSETQQKGRTIAYSVPQHLHFGKAPRSRYPLVVVILLEDALAVPNDNSIVSAVKLILVIENRG